MKKQGFKKEIQHREYLDMTEFVTIKGKTGTYQVSKDSCTCGDYIYRKKDIGGKCKHMESLEKND